MNNQFKESIQNELNRLDLLGTSKRHELAIEGFTKEQCPQAIIKGKNYLVFNSNDYLGLRFDSQIHAAEKEGLSHYGSGAGAVRFISGTLAIHQELERALAAFHSREAAMIFSSAFSANVSIIQALCKGPSAGSLISDNVVVISDELNHRSIIDGIRVSHLPAEQRAVFKHADYQELDNLLASYSKNYKRAIIISDGIFSMLGEAQQIDKIRKIIDKNQNEYSHGIIFLLDDSHGVGCFGASGRGCEEDFGIRSDLLVGTLGKAFGVEGGYVVGDKLLIDYLRESAASYIYSNPISPGSAAAALHSIKIINSEQGKQLLKRLNENISFFKQRMREIGFAFAADSKHAIQPLLIADSLKTKQLVQQLFDRGVLVTAINYPVVAKGKEEIRVQLSALHGKQEIELFIQRLCECAKQVGVSLTH